MSETADQAATRRRWITLAEIVGLAGVVIAGLTLYTGWADRRADQAASVAARSSEAREKARVELVATAEDGGRRLTLRDERHDIRDASFTFPRALGVAKRAPEDAAIEADWFAAPLLKLTDGGADERTGRLPVLVSATYWDGDVPRTTSAIYDIVWRTEGRLLRGRALRIETLKLRQRAGTQAALDAAWAREKP